MRRSVILCVTGSAVLVGAGLAWSFRGSDVAALDVEQQSGKQIDVAKTPINPESAIAKNVGVTATIGNSPNGGSAFNGGAFTGGFCGSLGAVGGIGESGHMPTPPSADPK